MNGIFILLHSFFILCARSEILLASSNAKELGMWRYNRAFGEECPVWEWQKLSGSHFEKSRTFAVAFGSTELKLEMFHVRYGS